MFPLVDPDVVDILAAVGVLDSMLMLVSLILMVSLLLKVSLLLLVSLFLLTLPCCPHFVGVVRYYYRLAAVYGWNLLSWCCWRPCCFWLSAFAAFTMMLAPSFCWWHPFCCWLAPPKLFFSLVSPL
jgi:hypothetical protein